MRTSLSASLLSMPLSMALCLCAFGVGAQQVGYPNKPVSVIVPFSPGSAPEVDARIYLTQLGRQLNQNFILDFKPGGSTIIGAGYVAKSQADGYTLLLATASNVLIPMRPVKTSFDLHNAFAPVTLLSKRWAMLVAHPSMPSNWPEFMAYARANPGKVNYATNGAGSQLHLSGAWLSDIANIDITFVHDKGLVHASSDLLAGRVHLILGTLTTGMQYVKAGKAKALGMANLTRNPAYPDIPTLTEQGLKDFEFSSWIGLFAPAKTPPAVINLLSSEAARAARLPELAMQMSGNQLVGSTPEQFVRFMASETERWGELVRQKGIDLQD